MTRFRLDFACVGPQRTATSWMHRALSAHPNVGLPKDTKETFFFDEHFGRGLDWYAGQFATTGEGRCYGEVGPTYFESVEVCDRMRRAFPELRIVISVRNPIARTYSLLVHEYAKGRIGAAFLEALDRIPRLVESGRYALHAPRWEAAFGTDRVAYVLQSDIVEAPEAVFQGVCDFIGVALLPLPEALRGRFGERMVPRWPPVARLAALTARSFRRVGLHSVVEAGKRMGLKRVYQGGDDSRVEMNRPLFERLARLHLEDMQFLEERLGRVFPGWRDFEATKREMAA